MVEIIKTLQSDNFYGGGECIELANGGRIFLSVDTGTLTVGARSIFIKRDWNGNT
jgi:hypothetical protein